MDKSETDNGSNGDKAVVPDNGSGKEDTPGASNNGDKAAVPEDGSGKADTPVAARLAKRNLKKKKAEGADADADVSSGEDSEVSDVEYSSEVSNPSAEVEYLKADERYAQFTRQIVEGKKIPEEDFESADSDYEPPKENFESPDSEPSEEVTQTDEPSEMEEQDANEEDEETTEKSISSADDGDDEDITEEERELRSAIADVGIPMEILEEARRRFPPFWRTLNRLEAISSSYDSVEDPNFVPSQSELDRASQEGEESESSDDEGEKDMQAKDVDVEKDEEIEVAAELEHITSQEKVDQDLADAMDALSVVPEAPSAGGDGTSAAKAVQTQPSIVRAIMDHEVDEKQNDPDYDPTRPMESDSDDDRMEEVQ